MFFVRYLDCVLVVLTAPFVVVAGLPVLGYVVAAVAWLLSRLASHLLEQAVARRPAGDLRATVGITFAGMMARVWLVGLAVLAVGLAGSRDDGAMAAALLLAAFTVSLAMSFFTRSLDRKPLT